MANAVYTLTINGRRHGFQMADVDFSAGLNEMAYGLGETVVDSLYHAGAASGEVTVADSDTPEKRLGFKFDFDHGGPRAQQVLAIGRKLANATYTALEGAAA